MLICIYSDSKIARGLQQARENKSMTSLWLQKQVREAFLIYHEVEDASSKLSHAETAQVSRERMRSGLPNSLHPLRLSVCGS